MAITSVFGVAGLTGGGTFGDLEIMLDGALAVPNGGTGFTSQANARANLFSFMTNLVGDMYYRSATGTPGAMQRIQIGTQGQVLTVNAGVPQWMPATGGSGGGGISSVFGRTDANIVAMAGDYNASQITNAVSTQGDYPDPSWIRDFSYLRLINVPASFTPSAHTHPASEITGGVFAPDLLGTGSAGNTVFLRGDGVWASPSGGSGGTTPTFEIEGSAIGTADTLNFIKGTNVDLVGSYTAGRVDITISTAAGNPWTEDIDADRYNLLHVGQISTQYLTFCNDVDSALDVSMIGGRLVVDGDLHVEGDIHITGRIYRNGVPIL